MELTKEYFEKKFEEQKKIFITKDYFDIQFKTLDKRFKAIDQQFKEQRLHADKLLKEEVEGLARMVARGFASCATKEDLKALTAHVAQEAVLPLAKQVELTHVKIQYQALEKRVAHLEHARTAA